MTRRRSNRHAKQLPSSTVISAIEATGVPDDVPEIMKDEAKVADLSGKSDVNGDINSYVMDNMDAMYGKPEMLPDSNEDEPPAKSVCIDRKLSPIGNMVEMYGKLEILSDSDKDHPRVKSECEDRKLSLIGSNNRMHGKLEILLDSDEDERPFRLFPNCVKLPPVPKRVRNPWVETEVWAIGSARYIPEDASSGEEEEKEVNSGPPLERDLSHLPTCEYNAFIDDETNEHYIPHYFPPRVAPKIFIFSLGEMAKKRFEELSSRVSLSDREHRKVFCLACMDFIMRDGTCGREHDEFNDDRLQEFWLENFPHEDGVTKQEVLADLKEIAEKWN